MTSDHLGYAELIFGNRQSAADVIPHSERSVLVFGAVTPLLDMDLTIKGTNP